MSEAINNREYRQRVLKELIMELHNGKSVGEVKERFAKLIEGVTASEISEMEQNLIMEGMPVEEVQRLCDVHAEVFKGSIEHIHKPSRAEEMPGHPVHTIRLENKEVKKLIEEDINPILAGLEEAGDEAKLPELAQLLDLLWQIDKHYSRKENLLFPYLEKYGITAPPKVMWGVDDEIRNGIKELKKLLEEGGISARALAQKFREVVNKAVEMIFKEENILIPMAMDTLTEDEWLNIAEESGEIGYTLIDPPPKWAPYRTDAARDMKKDRTELPKDNIRFETGILRQEEMEAMFNTMPVDITFIDKDDVVKFFSNNQDRIFARTKAVIGRTVQNCHPPASVHIVNKMLQDFKEGRKDHEDFWIRMGDRYVYIRYFAVRGSSGEYLGTMEVSQDIKPIQQIQGEKRLMS
ncbi:MAG: Hemerythrin domain protein [Firmicutes bacterium]|nr:Hemerythrin domain protein [Bacillota bacterium]MDI6705950.1 DUF438 domain-containing protein [Bacillota bacterium]